MSRDRDIESNSAPIRPRSALRTAAVIAGSLVGLVGVALVIAGGALLWGNSEKDDAGYLSTGKHRLHTGAYAITTDDLDVDLGAPGGLVNHDRFGRIRIAAESRNATPVFVGIAPTRDVARYLARTAHSAITDIDDGPFRSFHVTYQAHDGTRHPAAPAQQRFWVASAHGAGSQAMTWKIRDGNWSVVLMNADGSAGVDAGVRAGADIPFLSPAGWISLGGGLVLVALAGGLIVLGTRAPRRTATSDRSDRARPAVTA
jgi:hypothetical protein